MGPRPYSERTVLPSDSSNSSVSIDSDATHITTESSPGTLSSANTPSPIDHDIIADIITNPPEVNDPFMQEIFDTACYPAPGDSMPFDHAFPDFLRQLTNERNLANVQSLRLRVISRLVSLQRMSLFTTNLRELDLEGSILGSLRDIGCNLKLLQVLKVGNCQLDSLDGTFGLTSLRQLYAQRNMITDVTPCSNLPHIQHIDLSNNRIRNISYAGFLSVCRKLKSMVFVGNPATQLSDYRSHVKRILPQLENLDGVSFNGEEVSTNYARSATVLSEDSEEETDFYNNSFGNDDSNSSPMSSKLSEMSLSDLMSNMESHDLEVQEIFKSENRNTFARDSNLLILRKERDEIRQFACTRQLRSQNINIEQTEDLLESTCASSSSLVTDSTQVLTLPPLRGSEREPKRVDEMEKEQIFLSSGSRGELKKIKSKTDKSGEKSVPVSPTPDAGHSGASNNTDSQDLSLGVRARRLSKCDRPVTANIHNSGSSVENDHPIPKKRPSTAGTETIRRDYVGEDSIDNQVTHKSLTTGLPMCGNLAVALRNRRRYEQERGDFGLLKTSESDVIQLMNEYP